MSCQSNALRGNVRRIMFVALGVAYLSVSVAARATGNAGDAAAPDSSTLRTMEMSAAQLFAYADAARDRGDFVLAEKAYRALSLDPDIELRTEARFRLGKMLADLGKYREAAVEFRAILDEKPDAAAVRLELARMMAQIGNLGAARRELRAAEATGLPPEVSQLVRFYAGALDAYRPLGGSFELAIAPSNNINRATRSDTLGTVIGDFILNEDAKAKSGIGLSVRGQVYARLPLSNSIDLLARISGDADLFRYSDFNDVAVNFEAGPQIRSGVDRLSISPLLGWRWYGMRPYSFNYGVTGNWLHPAGKRGEIRVDASLQHERNRLNDLQNSNNYALAVTAERAFSARFGGAASFFASREVARDPGYSTAQAGLNTYFFREMGNTTAVLNLGYSRLEADRRLFLYLKRRKEDRFTASLSATFRALKVGTFAPLARLKYENNRSTVELYDFTRLSAELGVTSAF